MEISNYVFDKIVRVNAELEELKRDLGSANPSFDPRSRVDYIRQQVAIIADRVTTEGPSKGKVNI